MKKTILLSFVLFSAVFAQNQNPPSIWCDVHSRDFIRGGNEYLNGNCYDVYKHDYWDNNCKCTRTHKAIVKCKQ